MLKIALRSLIHEQANIFKSSVALIDAGNAADQLGFVNKNEEAGIPNTHHECGSNLEKA